MRTISPAFKAHLAQEVTTLATCWKATLTNDTVLGFTDHTRDITFDNVVYKSSSGYTPSAIEGSSMLNVDNMEIEAVLNSPEIKEAELLAGVWDFAKIQIFWVNWADLSMGRMVLKTGTMGQITIKNTSFVAEVRGLTQAYTNVIGELTSPMCRASLGDARCKVNMAPYTDTGVVSAVDSTNTALTDAGRTEAGPAGGVGISGISRAQRAVVTTSGAHGFTEGSSVYITGVVGMVLAGSTDNLGVFKPGSGASVNGYSYTVYDVTPTTFSIPVDTRLGSTDSNLGPPYDMVYSAYASGGVATPQGNSGYWAYGSVTFTSGLNAGLTMEVKSYSPGNIELQLPMPYPVAIGDAYTIRKGCGKRFVEDCKDTFNNVINFRGEPHLPGADQVMVIGGAPETPLNPVIPETAP